MNENNKCEKGIISRSIIGLVLFSFIIINTIFQVGVLTDQPDGIIDRIQIMFKPINNFFNTNKQLKHILFIISNLILDISSIFLIIIWLSLIKNTKIIFSLAIFFFIKIVCELIFIVKPAQNNLIDYPGFPSIFYSYNKNNFFFFSGTVGYYIIMINEFCENKNDIKLCNIFSWINTFNLLLFIFISLGTYSLYSIDIFTGIVTGLYCIKLGRFINERINLRYKDENIDNEIDFFEDKFSFLKIKKEELPEVNKEVRNDNDNNNNEFRNSIINNNDDTKADNFKGDISSIIE